MPSTRATDSCPSSRPWPRRASRPRASHSSALTPATLLGLGDKLACPSGGRERRACRSCRARFEPRRGRSSGRRRDDPRRNSGHRIPVAGQGGRRRRRPRDAPRRPARGSARRPGQRLARGPCRLRRRQRSTWSATSSGARHVEVQLLGRRPWRGRRPGRARLLGPAPPPEARRGGAGAGLSSASAARLHGLAVDVARTVGLRNAATAEFLLTPDGELLVPGGQCPAAGGARRDRAGDRPRPGPRAALDRSGQTRSATRSCASPQTPHDPHSHAIEVRISAEDPATTFAPAPGRIGALAGAHWAGRPDGRRGGGGEPVSGDYDPLLAKLLVVAPDRPQAIASDWLERSTSWRSAASRRRCRSIAG